MTSQTTTQIPMDADAALVKATITCACETLGRAAKLLAARTDNLALQGEVAACRQTRVLRDLVEQAMHQARGVTAAL